jgi:HD-like signal output (HDOD) protein
MAMGLPAFQGHQQVKLDTFIDRVEHLPPSPRLLVKLLDVFKQPDPNIDEVVNLISHDPAFTVEVLKRCNSAYFAGDKPAEDMFEAVSRLGFQEIYEIVLAMFAATALLPPGTRNDSHVEILWRHSLAVAVVARVLAQSIGEVIMVSAQRDDFAQAVLNAGMFHRPVVVTEKEIFGFDHAEVGARLLARWNLPPNIVAAVLHHHQLEGAGEFGRLAAIVQLANLIAHGTAEKLTGEPKGLQTATASLLALQLTPEGVTVLLPPMREGLERAKNLMPA